MWGDTPEQVVERVKQIKAGISPEEPVSAPSPIAPPPIDRTGKIAAAMTPEHKASIHAGLRHMAGMDTDRAQELNGVGFNKMDSELGGKLAELPDLTPRQAATAASMLGKYKRQLPSHIHEHIGDLLRRADEREEEEEKRAVSAPPAPVDPNVRIRGNTFPHKDELKRQGFRWDGDRKVWYRSREGFNPSRLPRGLSHYAAGNGGRMTIADLQSRIRASADLAFDADDVKEGGDIQWRTIGAHSHHGGHRALINVKSGEIHSGHYAGMNVSQIHDAAKVEKHKAKRLKATADLKPIEQVAEDAIASASKRRTDTLNPDDISSIFPDVEMDPEAKKPPKLPTPAKGPPPLPQGAQAPSSHSRAPLLVPATPPQQSIAEMREQLRQVGERNDARIAKLPPPPPVPLDQEIRDSLKSGKLSIPLPPGVPLSPELMEAYKWVGQREGIDVGDFQTDAQGNAVATVVCGPEANRPCADSAKLERSELDAIARRWTGQTMARNTSIARGKAA